MPNYQNGKIYSIRSRSRPDLIYIGSTTRRLSERFGRHKAPSASTSAKQIILIGDAYIELIENYSCNSKEELCRREGEIIRSMDCVNKIIAGRTKEEYREEHKEEALNRAKEYYENNKEKVKDYKQKYYTENKEIINKKGMEYYENNKEKSSDYKKKFYQENKNEILEKKKIKINCSCGSVIRKEDKARHFKSKKHKDYEETLKSSSTI